MFNEMNIEHIVNSSGSTHAAIGIRLVEDTPVL